MMAIIKHCQVQHWEILDKQDSCDWNEISMEWS